MGGHRKAKAVRYQDCMVDEIVFLNRRSSLYHAAPEFLVYSELLLTKWPYIHGPKSVKPEWLANYGESSCDFSEVERQKPFYIILKLTKDFMRLFIFLSFICGSFCNVICYLEGETFEGICKFPELVRSLFSAKELDMEC